MQGGYGALSQLNYLLGIQPQTASQATIGGGGNTPGTTYNVPGGSFTPNGIYPGTGGGNGATASLRGMMGESSILGTPLQPSTGVVTNETGSVAGGYGSLLAPFTASTMAQYSPAYQFQREQGMQGVLNGSASGQGALSGAAQQALVGFNQNYANTAYGNAFNQYQTQQGNIYNRLAGIAQLGQTSAANTGQQGTSLAATTGQAISNVGTAQAGGTVGAANALSGSLSSLGSIPLLLSMQRNGSV